ncbi:hypothetical protein P154DRAFT_149801 [Amniculicola lignicola CBS 123094]|uniref:Uncharacterized protein n=1 Tax=Amniculicola lignicola CBS 123094 TaxID=1392246 RepID=A0A6A5WJF8_9PLEO|nr:hypothetical protein P154DRAFT_149801 [Amniculicola lignicola CBS 123094]
MTERYGDVFSVKYGRGRKVLFERRYLTKRKEASRYDCFFIADRTVRQQSLTTPKYDNGSEEHWGQMEYYQFNDLSKICQQIYAESKGNEHRWCMRIKEYLQGNPLKYPHIKPSTQKGQSAQEERGGQSVEEERGGQSVEEERGGQSVQEG